MWTEYIGAVYCGEAFDVSIDEDDGGVDVGDEEAWVMVYSLLCVSC